MSTDIEVVEANILDYLSHLHNGDYMGAITTSMPLSKFCNILSVLLQSEDDETVGSTALFIRDLVMACFHHPQCAEFGD